VQKIKSNGGDDFKTLTNYFFTHHENAFRQFQHFMLETNPLDKSVMLFLWV
jgi:hypothetical protein